LVASPDPAQAGERPESPSPRANIVGGDAQQWSLMNLALALTHQTGRRLAEVGFLLILIAGIWLAAAQIPLFKMSTARTIVAGLALAVGGLLLLIATHWGHFG
jgi:hypothetical protein